MGAPAIGLPPCAWAFLSNLGQYEFFRNLLRDE
jgi:hypothetical protein